MHDYTQQSESLEIKFLASIDSDVDASKECMCVLSRVRLFATLWTVAHQAPLSIEFSRQEYWSRGPFPTPGDLPDSEIEPVSLAFLALAGGFLTTAPWGGGWDINRIRVSWSPGSPTCNDDFQGQGDTGESTCFGREDRCIWGHIEFEVWSGLSQETAGWSCSRLAHFTICLHKSDIAGNSLRHRSAQPEFSSPWPSWLSNNIRWTCNSKWTNKTHF